MSASTNVKLIGYGRSICRGLAIVREPARFSITRPSGAGPSLLFSAGGQLQKERQEHCQCQTERQSPLVRRLQAMYACRSETSPAARLRQSPSLATFQPSNRCSHYVQSQNTHTQHQSDRRPQTANRRDEVLPTDEDRCFERRAAAHRAVRGWWQSRNIRVGPRDSEIASVRSPPPPAR